MFQDGKSRIFSICFKLFHSPQFTNKFLYTLFLWTKESPSYSVVHLGTFELKAKLKRHLKFE